MTSSDRPSDNGNLITDFFQQIPTPFFVAFVTFIWAGSLYHSLEPYELGTVVTYGIVVGTAIPVGLLFQQLHRRIRTAS